MGFLKSIGNVFPTSGFGFLDQLSGKSQQKDANKMAMMSWRLMNDYNHPIQQMERLKAAGLNPLLVYGSGSVAGNTSGAPSLQGGGISTPLESAFKGIGNIMSVIQGKANIDNTRAQTQASTAAAGASGAQAANLNAQAAFQETKNQFAEKTMIADLDYKKAQTNLARKQGKVADTQARKLSAEADIAQGEADIFGSAGGAKGASAIGSGIRSAGKFIRGVVK